MKSFSILLLAVSLLGVSCERHEFDGPNGTKQLHEHHAAGGAHEAAGEASADHAETEEGDVKDGKVLKH